MSKPLATKVSTPLSENVQMSRGWRDGAWLGLPSSPPVYGAVWAGPDRLAQRPSEANHPYSNHWHQKLKNMSNGQPALNCHPGYLSVQNPVRSVVQTLINLRTESNIELENSFILSKLLSILTHNHTPSLAGPQMCSPSLSREYSLSLNIYIYIKP